MKKKEQDASQNTILEKIPNENQTEIKLEKNPDLKQLRHRKQHLMQHDIRKQTKLKQDKEIKLE